MTMVKRIVCLANSRKLNGRCVAGKEFVRGRPGEWIRPVSVREHEEVSEYERQFEDGSDPQVLDIIEVPLLDPKPRGYQQENWLLDPYHYWARAARATRTDLAILVDPIEPLWICDIHTYSGLNDKIPLVQASAIRSSLRLVHVNVLSLRVCKPGLAFGNPKRRVQGRFRHGAHDYYLWVTDPVYERKFLLKDDGDYRLGECFLTVSLGEPFNDDCHKLIAAIIERDPMAGR